MTQKPFNLKGFSILAIPGHPEDLVLMFLLERCCVLLAEAASRRLFLMFLCGIFQKTFFSMFLLECSRRRFFKASFETLPKKGLGAFRKRILERKRWFCSVLAAFDENPRLRIIPWIQKCVILTIWAPLLNPVKSCRLAWYHSEVPWQ